MEDLDVRLTRFLAGFPGAEAIDGLHIAARWRRFKRADFLLWNRQLIAEIKSLQDDPSYKVETTIGPERGRDDFPLFYGSMELDKVLQNLPDGAAIKRRVLQRLVRSVKGGFQNADKQIAHTKEIFDIPTADGLLILLNDGVEILSPEVIAWQIARMLQVRDESGTARYPNVNVVWVITETHFIPVQGWKALPALLMRSEQVPLSSSNWDLLNALQPAWAAFNGVPMVKTDGHIADAVSMRRNAAADIDNGQITREELWRRAYQANPYLRAMPEPALVSHGAGLIQELAPHFMAKAGTAARDPIRNATLTETAQKALERFAHFLEEAKFRGLDMHKVVRHIRSQSG